MKHEIKESDSFEYDVKCRKCCKVTRMFFGNLQTTEKHQFTKWVNEHSTFPIHKQCDCDNGMMLLHDIVSYGPMLKI